MYKGVLAAVNEHVNSESSARYALALAKACNAKIIICFIAGKDMPQSCCSRAEDAVARLFNEAKAAGIPAESLIKTGDPVEEIAGIARREGINIVFASTRREDVERRFYAGTLARRLSLDLPCSVALVRSVHMGRLHPGRILVPLKARIAHVKERAYFAGKLAEGFHSRVVVFHAPKPITGFFHGEIHLKPVEWEERVPADVSAFMGQLRKYKVAFESKLSPGAASKGITLEAAAKRHDLIIMGASERSMPASFLKGNPVEDVLRATPCNLIILKARHGN